MLRLSILDRAVRREDESDADVFARVVERARRAERLGYTRFHLAEHHAVPGISGSVPALLAAAVAGRTSRIRVGTSGIMLPAHRPIVAAEHISTLAALYPGRVDAGIGSSLGFTAAVRDALGQERSDAQAYPQRLEEFVSFLAGTSSVTLRPKDPAALDGGEPTPVYLLSAWRSMQLAARLGLGVIAGGPQLLPDGRRAEHEQLAAYRRDFRPGPLGDRPRSLIALPVAVADTEEAARDLLLPEAWSQVAARSIGSFEPTQPPGKLKEGDLARATGQQRDRLDRQLGMAVVGTPDQVRDRLEEIARYCGVDEIMVASGSADVAAQERSDELLAEALLD